MAKEQKKEEAKKEAPASEEKKEEAPKPEPKKAPKKEKKKEAKQREKTKKSAFYKIEGGAVQRIRKPCTKCGAGVFMAQHKDRATCGACGYTEWTKSS